MPRLVSFWIPAQEKKHCRIEFSVTSSRRNSFHCGPLSTWVFFKKVSIPLGPGSGQVVLQLTIRDCPNFTRAWSGQTETSNISSVAPEMIKHICQRLWWWPQDPNKIQSLFYLMVRNKKATLKKKLQGTRQKKKNKKTKPLMNKLAPWFHHHSLHSSSF